MTKQIIQVPAGFLSTDVEPTGTWSDRYTVLYVPHEGETRFEMGTARFNSASKAEYRWKTVDGDNVGDSGRAVFAWRPDTAPEVVRIAAPEAARVEPRDRAQYDDAIAILADHHMELVEDGEKNCVPEGIQMLSRFLEVPVEQLERDYMEVARGRLAKIR